MGDAVWDERRATDGYEHEAGNSAVLASEDDVEGARRIVDPVVKAGPEVREFEPGTWGPSDANEAIVAPGGRSNQFVGESPPANAAL